ncbi:MAG: acetyltransferase [Prevotellaceae bacterium]|jgi:UDP-3-O-[3-hydroxymyristoyl] glucosamine N-acyltransferase|nr:acetyltransferase [Prevotellaceae bacterium]
MKYLFIIGGKSTSLEIREAVEQYYRNIYSEIYNVIGDEENCSVENYIRDSDLKQFIFQISEKSDIHYIIGVTNLKIKIKYISFFEENEIAAINVLHPSAYIAPSAKIGFGNYIGQNAIISTNAVVGNHNVVSAVIIGHDVIIGSNCVLNPGAVIAGNAQISDNVLVGANSFIFQGKSIGKDTSIDALTYIDRDIPNNSVCSNRPNCRLKIFKKIHTL